MLSVIIAAVVIFAFGAIWFTFLFGKTWAKLMNFPADMMSGGNKGMAKEMVINFLGAVLSAWVVSYLYPELLATTYTEFAKDIIIIWLGFSFPIYMNQALWERKSWNLVWLNSAYGIIYFALASGVIYYMAR